MPATAAVKKLVTALEGDFFKTMNAMNKKQLEAVIQYLTDEYYNEGVSHISDENFDRLRETLIKKFGGSAEAAHEAAAEVTKEKVKLPFFLGSMDKIKPDKNNLDSWLAKFKGPYCLSDKLDGISGLRIKIDGKHALYTRGNGTVGQNISHVLPFINCGDFTGLDTYAVRGELIVNKANYDKVKEGKRGARQMVAGLVGKKTITAAVKADMALIDFVAYEVIVPEALPPSEQFKLLDNKSTFNVAKWTQVPEVSIEKLSEVLTGRKAATTYEIDGVIVSQDTFYPRVKGNPDHAFAFKMAFAEQQATTEVLKVDWEVSKDGHIKPTVNFEPVNISGSIIQYASGFNAAFIQANGIGPGAYVDIIRSGDVIPYIKEVKSAAPGGPQMPAVKWHWNETHVDAIVDDLEDNPDVKRKALLYFANTLEIGYCGEGNITKLFEMGITTIPKFLALDEATLVAGGGFGKVSAKKLVEEIAKARQNATIVQWAVGSGIFGRGIGTKRTELAFHIVPKNLEASPELVAAVSEIPGWSKESAVGFVENLPTFKRFIDSLDIKPKVATPVKAVSNGKLKGQVVLFTGFHPKDLEAAVLAQGGELADTFGKKVTILVVKDASVSNGKTEKALATGIAVKTADQFRAMI
jgi:NAD-dependent DNA ligase